MPIKHAGEKALRQSIKRRGRNLAVKTQLKSLIKRTRKLAAAKKASEALGSLSETFKALDKAAQKKIIKKNTASRIKSRLSQLVNAVKK